MRSGRTAYSAAEIREALEARLVASAGEGPAVIVPELRVGSDDVTYLIVQEPYDPAVDRTASRARRTAVRSSECPTDHKHGYYTERRRANVDIAFIRPESLDLYEIKGDADSLVRLRTQVTAYDDTGTRNTLVIAERHLKRAHTAVPEHWGIIVASGEPLVLSDVRAAAPNSKRRPIGLLNPLYSWELWPLGEAFGAPRGKARLPRYKLLRFLADPERSLDVDLLTAWMSSRLSKRDHDSLSFVDIGENPKKKLLATPVGDLSMWPTPVIIGPARSLFGVVNAT